MPRTAECTVPPKAERTEPRPVTINPFVLAKPAPSFLLKAGARAPFFVGMVRPLFEAAVAGLNQASGRFERSAAQVTRLAGNSSAAESAATVSISAEARGPLATEDTSEKASLEGALVDTRIAKYQFIANLKVLQTGDEMSKELAKILK